MPVEQVAKKNEGDNVIEFYDKFREKRDKILRELFDKHSDLYAPEGNKDAVEFTDDDGNVFHLTGKVHKEDLDGIIASLADAQAYHAKYTTLSHHLLDAASASTLGDTTERGLQEFLEEVAKTAQHDELVGLSPQNLYGKLIQAAAGQKIGEKAFGKMWYDAQRNNQGGRKARAKLVDLLISDIQQQLTQNSIYHNTAHLTDADYGRLESYKLVIGKMAQVLSQGNYTPNLRDLHTLSDIRGELTSNVARYLINPEMPHEKDYDRAAFRLPKPKAFGKEKVEISDLRKANDELYKPQRRAA